ncbi:unnamed protein product [Rhizoctonia solani]|uniref:Nucleolus and neural progenitor protein-like N-terminal domain-containing protein n=1 Tax=Rhizoctonia solani TaxID=456999 RepID=A0A8H3GTI0_9AGAM|nr:unnamed protein product [Rhizoctonia solani]
MPPRRFRLLASADFKPRDNLDIPAATQLLKQLKYAHKNGRASQKLLFTEMHLLERVYYKGKNQHGLSLFWKSVVSVRRISTRIYETNLPGLLEALGGMFHEEPFEGQKVFSGAWTRVPPPATVAQILERLLDIGILLKSAITSFQKAYRAFCSAMSNTAFLQLMIVLVSIVSRASAVASTLLDITLSITPYIYAVFETLEPPKSLLNKISKRLKNSRSSSTAKDSIEPPTKPTLNAQTPVAVYMDDVDEDLGLSIIRSTLPTTTAPSPPVQAIVAPDSLKSPALSTTPVIETTTPLSPSPPPSQPPHAPILPKNLPAQPPAHAAPVATSTKPKKKRKKTRDEIDAIFG